MYDRPAAQKRALDAIAAGGTMAGTLRNQDYGEQKDAATAQDSIDRFNTTNQQNVMERNANAQNEAQKYNLNQAQSIADKNTGISNQQEMYNKGLIQKQFDNQTKVVAGEQTPIQDLAKAYVGNGDANSAAVTGFGQGVGAAATAVGQKSGNAADNGGTDDWYTTKKKPAAGESYDGSTYA